MAVIITGVITLGYLLPLIVLRHLIRELSRIKGHNIDHTELMIHIMPLLNIIGIPIVYGELREARGNRNLAEMFFNVNKGGGGK